MNGVYPHRLLEGKVGIITGGASGFGESTVRLFAKHGAKVVIADVQDKLGLSLCNDLVTKIGDNVIYLHCDVTKESDIENTVNTAVSKFGKLDIMFNNAGIPGNLDFTILNSDNENFKRVFDVNVFGSFLGAKHAARVMIPAKRGVILFTSSVASVLAGESPHSYTVSKHAVIGLMKNLCVELGQHGIRVNCISPGSVSTPLLTTAMGVDKQVVDDILCASAVLKGVVPMADDVAEAAVYLGSDASKFVTGVNLVVDGGYSTTNPTYSRVIKQTFEDLAKKKECCNGNGAFCHTKASYCSCVWGGLKFSVSAVNCLLSKGIRRKLLTFVLLPPSVNGIQLNKRKYVVEILEKAHMVNCNPSRTPVDTESKLGVDGDPQVCLYIHDLREPYFSALKRNLWYVLGTLEYGLQLFSSSTTSLVAYSDAELVGCPTTRRLTSGYCVFLDNNLLSWSAKRQPTLSRSSAEAEYRDVANDVAETCWLSNVNYAIVASMPPISLLSPVMVCGDVDRCVTMRGLAFAGNYVNFGVFELYGDRALADALGIALKMTLSVPLADILAYRKFIIGDEDTTISGWIVMDEIDPYLGGAARRRVCSRDGSDTLISCPALAIMSQTRYHRYLPFYIL
ncbi:secoisolariciresinol dehydrogenase-like protein [Tanacetum coccineum]|uniref:Secoisolariciresinol dehydrogenase-like protein n=1 Tax=Tanacetum coccineum TaxID=301880 RepID=A0ABQ4XIK2_9ASTR